MDSDGNDGVRDCRVVRASGELDLVTAWAFGLDLCGELLLGGNGFLVVDLRLVTFMDCSALRELVGARRQSREVGGWLRLVYDQPPIQRLLAATGLAGRFPRYATVLDARFEVTALPVRRPLRVPDTADSRPLGL